MHNGGFGVVVVLDPGVLVVVLLDDGGSVSAGSVVSGSVLGTSVVVVVLLVVVPVLALTVADVLVESEYTRDPQQRFAREYGPADLVYVDQFSDATVAPAGVPQPVINRLHIEITGIVSSPETRKRLESEGAEPLLMSSADFGRFIQSETKKWSRVGIEAGVKGE